MDKIPVSVIIITHNEEKNIGDALRSVIDFSEVIVVDSFSTDNTIKICEEYRVVIHQKEWMGFSRQKQYALELSQNQWVLSLDADERVTPELKEEIRKAVRQERYFGFYIPRRNFFLGKWIRHSGWWPDYTLKLFRRDKGRFDNREVHEKVLVDGEVGRIKSPIEHYSYREISDFIRKMDHYAILASKEIIKKRKSRIRLLFDLLSRPPLVFIKMYLLKRGFLDGLYGFYLASFYSFYTFLKYAQALEARE